MSVPEFSVSVPNHKIFSEIEIDLFDAVYLGQPYCLKFAGNYLIDLSGLVEAIERLRAAGRKAYLTTPAIPKGSDLAAVRKAVEVAVKAGVDGVEAHDVGVFRLIKADFPGLRVHVGNFANVYNEQTAAVWRGLGAARIVPSHELTAEELAVVVKTPGVEFERPVHGLLPLGMAFACLFTEDDAGGKKDACRQQCARPVYLELDGWRMRSGGTSLLTGEDYCLIEHIDQLVKLGLAGLRLETVFDGAEKINILGSIYCRAIEGGAISADDLRRIEELAPRGLCNGWHFGKSGRDYQGAAAAETAGGSSSTGTLSGGIGGRAR